MRFKQYLVVLSVLLVLNGVYLVTLLTISGGKEATWIDHLRPPARLGGPAVAERVSDIEMLTAVPSVVHDFSRQPASVGNAQKAASAQCVELGGFSARAATLAAANLGKKLGVAKIAQVEQPGKKDRLWLQFIGLDEAQLRTLRGAAVDYPNQKLLPCSPRSPG